MRVAAIDIGTNTTRLLVADVEDGRVATVLRRTTITTLGQGVDGSGRLAEEALDRVRAALASYAEDAALHSAERRLAVLTSAARDAANGALLVAELRERFGFEPRLLSGAEEAAVTFAGVATDGPVAPGTLVLDIGGGSTELVVGGPAGVESAVSLQLGGVRLTERFLHSDPPIAAEIEMCAAHVRSLLPPLAPRAAIGVAGTVTTLAALDLALDTYDPTRVHGHTIMRVAVEEWTARLLTLKVSERRALPCMEYGRAPVIAGGLVVLRETLRAYALDGVRASERDLLDGAALLAAGPTG